MQTRVLPLMRAIFVAGFCVTAVTGPVLYLLPGRTDDYWAWTIAASPSAAFLGAAYTGAAVMLALGARTREWRRARVVPLATTVLTSLTLLATLVYPEPFVFGEGGAREAVAWIWLVVYIAVPALALAAFVAQERAGGAREYQTELPALAASRLALGVVGAVLAAVGIGLVAGWDPLAERWPWPLPPLPAVVVGAWLCTFAAGFLWFALRDRDWRGVRIAALPAAFVVVLDLLAAVRLHESFDGGVATALYVAGLGALLAAVAATALVEERRLRRAGLA